jgi:hypothetical protein
MLEKHESSVSERRKEGNGYGDEEEGGEDEEEVLKLRNCD